MRVLSDCFFNKQRKVHDARLLTKGDHEVKSKLSKNSKKEQEGMLPRTTIHSNKHRSKDCLICLAKLSTRFIMGQHSRL